MLLIKRSVRQSLDLSVASLDVGLNRRKRCYQVTLRARVFLMIVDKKLMSEKVKPNMKEEMIWVSKENKEEVAIRGSKDTKSEYFCSPSLFLKPNLTKFHLKQG